MTKLKSEKEIALMKEGGRILHAILTSLVSEVRAGMSTRDIDDRARKLIEQYGVSPSFLDYHGFPAVICTSVDDEVVHVVPSGRILKTGDLLKLDFGIQYKGFHTDAAVTVLVGNGKIEDKKEQEQKLKLIRVTKEALARGIVQAKVGNKLGDIGEAIQKFIERNRFSVARDLVGHGIGRNLHEEPYVQNYGKAGTGQILVEGMVLAIEPIVMAGGWQVKNSPDGQGFVTKDGSLAAHFEHTVAITKKGPLILTV